MATAAGGKRSVNGGGWQGGIRGWSNIVLVVVLIFAHESPSQVVRAVGYCNARPLNCIHQVLTVIVTSLLFGLTIMSMQGWGDDHCRDWVLIVPALQVGEGDKGWKEDEAPLEVGRCTYDKEDKYDGRQED